MTFVAFKVWTVTAVFVAGFQQPFIAPWADVNAAMFEGRDLAATAFSTVTVILEDEVVRFVHMPAPLLVTT